MLYPIMAGKKKGTGKKEGNAPAPEVGEASPSSPASQGEVNVITLITEINQLRALIAQLKDENKWLRSIVENKK